jgi:hypothetical protein
LLQLPQCNFPSAHIHTTSERAFGDSVIAGDNVVAAEATVTSKAKEYRFFSYSFLFVGDLKKGGRGGWSINKYVIDIA